MVITISMMTDGVGVVGDGCSNDGNDSDDDDDDGDDDDDDDGDSGGGGGSGGTDDDDDEEEEEKEDDGHDYDDDDNGDDEDDYDGCDADMLLLKVVTKIVPGWNQMDGSYNESMVFYFIIYCILTFPILKN